jgi:AcrR family transcriptional regulator
MLYAVHAMAEPLTRGTLTRAAVLAVARNLLIADGLAGVSLRKVANRLGVTAPALYAHVESKDELLRALAEEEFEHLIARLNAAGDAPDPIGRIRAQSVAYVEHALENPALFRIMFVFRPDFAGPDSVEVLPLASKAFAEATAAVQDAIEAHLLVETDALMASLTIWSAVHGVATVLLAGPGLGTDFERALIDSVVDNVVAGLTGKSRTRDTA